MCSKNLLRTKGQIFGPDLVATVSFKGLIFLLSNHKYQRKRDIYLILFWFCSWAARRVHSWAVGDCYVGLKMRKEIYSFKLTMLWLSLSSSLPLWPRRCHVALILHCASIWVSGKPQHYMRMHMINATWRHLRPQSWCAYWLKYLGIWVKTLKKKETTTAS